MISLKGKKIAISTSVIGGVGGAERDVFSVIKACYDCKIDVYTNNVIDSEFIPKVKNLTIFINRIQNWNKKNKKQYDLYLHYNFLNSFYIGNKINCKLKMLNPCGNKVFDREDLFDFIISQSPEGIKLFKNKKKNILLNQPVCSISNEIQPVKKLPKKYFLTVFNPYGKKNNPIKGQDILYKISKKLPFKIIWCYSLKTKKWKGLKKNFKNIIYLESIPQSQLNYLYKNALAYISFSKKEGFGWSIADALLYQKPIISRIVGVLSYYKKPPEGIFFYKNKNKLIKITKTIDFSKMKPKYNLEFIQVEKFREKIALILKNN